MDTSASDILNRLVAEQIENHVKLKREETDPCSYEERTSETGKQAEDDDFRWPPGEEFKTIHSSNLFERMATRVSLQAIGDYIRNDVSTTTLYQKPFQERMDEADRELDKRINALIQDRKTAIQIQDAVNAYEGTVIDVYFALGMKAGAQLNEMLMGGFDKDY